MSLPHFYLNEQVIASEVEETFLLQLTKDDAKHARVLRLCAGEHIAVIDASQDYFECEIVSFDQDVPVVRVAQHLNSADDGYSVVLVQGLAKGDKMETVVRHATELGVREFIPLVCERSIVKLDKKKASSKTERWQAIAKSAAMQSGQPMIPDVQTPASLLETCDELRKATAVLVCWEEAPQTAHLANALSHAFPLCNTESDSSCSVKVAVVVGPEGGLSQREVDALLACNPNSSLITLGRSILRTETAGIVAPALVLYELNRLLHK